MPQLSQVNSIASVRPDSRKNKIWITQQSEVLGPRITRIDAKIKSFESAFAFIRVIRGLLLDSDLAQNSAQLVKIHGFGEMEIEAGLFAALDIFRCAKSSQRYGFNGSFSLGRGNQVVAAPVRQGNVAQDNIEFFGVDHFQSAPRAFGQRNFMPEITQEAGESLQRLSVIFDHEDTQTFAQVV